VRIGVGRPTDETGSRCREFDERDNNPNPRGGPYKRKVVTLAGEDVYFRNRLDDAVKEVKVDAITASNEGFKAIHDPTHPDADASGNVLMPNVEVMKEMVDMLTAARAYEAVATAFDATKNMALKTLDLGK